jgi:hypothetical protein
MKKQNCCEKRTHLVKKTGGRGDVAETFTKKKLCNKFTSWCTCGMKKRRRVFEKWPRIATTANVIPEK